MSTLSYSALLLKIMNFTASLKYMISQISVIQATQRWDLSWIIKSSIWKLKLWSFVFVYDLFAGDREKISYFTQCYTVSILQYQYYNSISHFANRVIFPRTCILTLTPLHTSFIIRLNLILLIMTGLIIHMLQLQ